MVKCRSFLKTLFINILNVLQEYCKNSSLAGVRYIVNDRLHILERIFWIICIILSSFGSYRLIKNYLDSFDQNAISLVIENISPNDKSKFPSIGICELGNKGDVYKEMQKFVNSSKKNKTINSGEDNDVENFIEDITFPNLYSDWNSGRICKELLLNNNNNIKCPMDNYKKIAEISRATCKDIFVSCKWNGIPFNCCKHFLPLGSTTGVCYLLNSIQTNANQSKFIDLFVDWNTGAGLLEIILDKPFKVYILNEEDIPFNMFEQLAKEGKKRGVVRIFKLHIQNIVNDLGVRNVPPQYRKCLFPDENSKDSAYKYYSFTACITDCLIRLQIKRCNCTQYDLITKDNGKTKACDFYGTECLHNNKLIKINYTVLQPWVTYGLNCECLPSCNEHEIEIIQDDSKVDSNDKYLKILITLQSIPTERYRRQAVRDKLDIVVAVGGILGLFMGASIISMIELIYFLTHRIFGFIFRNT